MSQEPTDLFSTARQYAACMREHHEAFESMGFTTDQSFELTRDIHKATLDAEMMSAFPMPGEGDSDD